MRNFTLITFIALLALPMQAQTIFESGFEDWTGNAANDWGGVRTNLPQSGVEQVSDDVHGGQFSARLIRTATGHQRYTTQDLSVVANTTYDVTFWVRGEGQIRLGLYDGRSTGSGYSPYNPVAFVPITGNTWQEVTLSITAVVDAMDAQFILSLQATVAPEHLVVDDVTITAQGVNPPETTTIQQIQESTAPDGASPLAGTAVITSGVVTGVIPGTNPGFFIQSGSGPWSGIFVFSDPVGLMLGDSVNVSGTVVEFNGQTQLASVSNATVLSSGATLAQTVISTVAANTEPYESVLVTVEAATCTNSGPFGQFTVNDGSGPTLTDDVIFSYPFQVGALYDITGVLQFAFSEWRILPRQTSDVQVVTSVAEQLFGSVALYPNPASERFTISGIRSNTTFVIRDAVGREVGSGSLLSMQNDIAVDQLNAGLYIITLSDQGAQWSTRFNVAR